MQHSWVHEGQTPEMPKIGHETRALKDGFCIIGTDFLCSTPLYQKQLSIEGGQYALAEVGDTVVWSPIDPLSLPFTRLKQFAELFLEYRFKRFTVEYVPSVPFTIGGTLAMGITHDPEYNPAFITAAGGEDARRRKIMTIEGTVLHQVLDQASTSVSMANRKEWMKTLHMEGEERWTMPGMFYQIWYAPPIFSTDNSVTESSAAGQLYLHYEVEFRTPALLRNDDVDDPLYDSVGDSFAGTVERQPLTTLNNAAPVPAGLYAGVVQDIWLSTGPSNGLSIVVRDPTERHANLSNGDVATLKGGQAVFVYSSYVPAPSQPETTYNVFTYYRVPPTTVPQIYISGTTWIVTAPEAFIINEDPTNFSSIETTLRPMA